MAGGIAAAFGFRSIAQQAEIDALRTERQLSEVASRIAETRLAERSTLAEKIITDLGRRLGHQRDVSNFRIGALSAIDPRFANARVAVVWDPNQQAGLMEAENLPPLSSREDYQLWVTASSETAPLSAGIFSVSTSGPTRVVVRTSGPFSRLVALAITVEQKGGAPTPGKPVLRWDLN